MTAAHRFRAADATLADGGRRCVCCQRVKPLAAFDDIANCRACVSAKAAASRGKGGDRNRRYKATEKGRISHAKYESSVLGKIRCNVGAIRRKIRILKAGPPYPEGFTCRSLECLEARLQEYLDLREKVWAERGRNVVEDGS